LSVGTQTSGIQHNSGFKNIGEIKMNGLRLRSNPTASLAYRNLSKTQFSLNNTLQRLSSGLRINKAADDSAGSAISTRMNSQITGMKQANRNAQDTNNLVHC